MSNSVDPDQAGQDVRPDLGSNCLQRLSSAKPGRQELTLHFLGTSANSAEPYQTQQNASSDQVYTVCLLNAMLKFELNFLLQPTTHKFGMDLSS